MTLANTMRTQTTAFLNQLGASPFTVNDPAFTPAVKLSPTHNQKHNDLQIIGRDRIAYAKITRAANGPGFEVNILPQAEEGAELCYWLPWVKNGALQLKLKPSGKRTLDRLASNHWMTRTASDSTAIELGLGNWVDRGIENADPDLFFTGMMNGCSLFVSGDALSPTVYHVNRASFAEKETMNLLRAPKDRDKDVNALKTNQMVKDFKRFDGRGVVSFKPLGQVTPTTQHLRNPLTGRAIDDSSRKRSDLIRSLVNGPVGQTYRIKAHFVCAFGVRDDDRRWGFYKQDIYQYSKADPQGNPIPNTLGTTATRATRFF